MNKAIYKCEHCGKEREEKLVEFDWKLAFGLLMAYFIMFFIGIYSGLTVSEKIQSDSLWPVIALFCNFALLLLGIVIGQNKK